LGQQLTVVVRQAIEYRVKANCLEKGFVAEGLEEVSGP
jgi:hypothetical protein